MLKKKEIVLLVLKLQFAMWILFTVKMYKISMTNNILPNLPQLKYSKHPSLLVQQGQAYGE